MSSSLLFMIIKYLSILLLISTSLQSIIITTAKTCPKSCSPDGSLTVRFPFRLINGHDHLHDHGQCDFTGFDLSCNDTISETTITLPTRVFTVREIEYSSKTLTVESPFDCLPKLYLERSFGLEGTPFSVSKLGSFTFLNCSSSATSSSLYETVWCLSGGDFKVAAIPAVLFESPPPFCEVLGNVSVPVFWSNRWWADYEWKIFLGNEVVLKWDLPGGGDCDRRGGGCGPDLPKRGLSKGTQYALFAISAIVILSFIYYNCQLKHCVIRLRNVVRVYTTRTHANQLNNENVIINSDNIQPNQLPRTTQTHDIINNNINNNVVSSSPGLDKAVIETYPKSLVGDSPKLLSSNYNACPICLTEYRPRDTLRTLPDCFHYFHSNYIDEWLKMNSSCPICRNSPLMSPYN